MKADQPITSLTNPTNPSTNLISKIGKTTMRGSKEIEFNTLIILKDQRSSNKTNQEKSPRQKILNRKTNFSEP
jgi:hypothetical protein